jgi:hypothetical protein
LKQHGLLLLHILVGALAGDPDALLLKLLLKLREIRKLLRLDLSPEKERRQRKKRDAQCAAQDLRGPDTEENSLHETLVTGPGSRGI